MLAEDEKAKLRFKLANANFQSIGRAQGLYLSALLVYICLVWGAGPHEISLHLAWLDLKVDGLWTITPFVLLILTLAYIGAVTAAMPAHKQLCEAAREVFGTETLSLSGLDTHKNITDYFAILQLSPVENTRPPVDQWPLPLLRRTPHLILPLIFTVSALTSIYASIQVSRTSPVRLSPILVAWLCSAIQVTFSVRPIIRFGARFFGAEKSSTFWN